MEEDLLSVSSPDTEQRLVTFAGAVQRELVLAGERGMARVSLEETASRLARWWTGRRGHPREWRVLRRKR